ncbi:FtsX-like permease family protein [Actinoplanes sp. CA-142083]|uniref:FtsX-like permease family protein n=1 Tax=Actinoplanes sp. CA-142083 TaxID=3239903 RepID=UPI003D8C76C8
MGRLLLVGRLAVRDLRRRRAEAALLLVAILAATTTLTLALVVRDAAGDPYQSTREATHGPDVVSIGTSAQQLSGLATQAGVADHSGPFPVAGAKIQAGTRTADAQVVGRDSGHTTVDQPATVSGDWVRPGGAVVEAAFAAELGLHAGDRITMSGEPFEVAGIAVTAAIAPYPGASCITAGGCVSGAARGELPQLLHDPGLIWVARSDLDGMATGTYVMNLRLTDPARAPAFAEAHHGTPWQSVLADATEVAGDTQILLMIGAWLLGLLAVASLSVLVGGRMADQTRRVGLLKAAGGTPGLVAAVLLAEYLLVAVVAAAAGLALGALTAPLLVRPTAGLIGSAGTPALTPATVVLVTALALGVAVLATLVPALRAARSSTVDALADTPRPPRRVGWLIAASARLPVPLLLAVRVAARRPRRVVLAVAGVAITVSGIYVALILNAVLDTQPDRAAALREVLLVWTVILLGLAAVNAVVITWATVLDNRHASALARALGATPRDVTAALSAAQVLPALLGAVIGVFPGGYLLFVAINAITGGNRDLATLPSLWQLAAVVLATVVVVAVLTALPARLGGRRPVAEALRSY